MNVNKTIFGALFLLGVASVAGAQSGQVQVALSVPHAISLTLIAPSSGVQVVNGSATEGRILVRMRQQEEGEPVRISVLARSNTAYRITGKVLSNSASTSPLIIRPEGAEPYAGTDHVMPDALNVHFESASAVSTSTSTSIFEGPRISRRGNETTPGNAIVLTLYVDMPEDSGDAELLLQMDPQT